MPEKSRVLLTGATGFLGSHLTRALVEAGYDLVLLKRSFSNTQRIANLLSDCDVYDLDRTSLERVFRASKIDIIIHGATCYGRKGESLSEIVESNVLFPLRLLETASVAGATAFFNTDTFFNRQGTPYDSLPGYVATKRQFVDLARLSSLRPNRFVNVRLEHLYGPEDDDSKFVPQILHQLIANSGELDLTAGEQERDFIYIDDAVSAFLVLLKTAPKGDDAFRHYDLGSGTATSIRTFVQTAWRLSEASTRLNFGALPYRPHEIMHSAADVRPLKAIGWRPRFSLEEGLRQTISWHVQSQSKFLFAGNPAPKS
jgi:CDP-paratose synthetase